MAIQNLVSASLAPETKAEILQKLGEIRKKLDFLLTLEAGEIQSIIKAGNNFSPFIEKAYNAVIEHPEIMSGVFDIAEFKKDYLLSKDLAAIVGKAKELDECLQNTLTAVNSDAMVEALEVYQAVRNNREKVPGLKVMGDEMAVFFKRAKRAPVAAKV